MLVSCIIYTRKTHVPVISRYQFNVETTYQTFQFLLTNHSKCLVNNYLRRRYHATWCVHYHSQYFVQGCRTQSNYYFFTIHFGHTHTWCCSIMNCNHDSHICGCWLVFWKFTFLLFVYTRSISVLVEAKTWKNMATRHVTSQLFCITSLKFFHLPQIFVQLAQFLPWQNPADTWHNAPLPQQ